MQRTSKVVLVVLVSSASVRADVTGFVGDTTIAGGWLAFEAASGEQMEVLVSPLDELAPVDSIPTFDGELGLTPTHEKRIVGSTWGTWSHGYTGEVFYTRGAEFATYSLPPGVTAFDAYIETGGFDLRLFTVVGYGADGTTDTVQFSAHGMSGASHFGFYTGGTTELAHLEVSSSNRWSIGEIRVSGALIGRRYCISTPNSTGDPAEIFAAGSDSVLQNDLTLQARPVPNDTFLFFFGPSQIQVPFGNGFLCAGGGLTRLLRPSTAAGNRARREVDLPTWGIGAGTLNFQCWFRDPAAGGAAYNTSDGLEITFVP